MKNKITLSIICVLLIAIIFINTDYFKSKNNQENNINNKKTGKVKSAQSIDKKIFSIKENISKIPHKTDNYYDPDHIYAESYILVDANSAQLLTKKNEHTQIPIASTTKIITAIIVLENYKLDTVIEISEKAVSQIGSNTGLIAGEKITVENLLYCLLVKSGNDAAYALAEHIGFNNFVDKMNKKINYLGLKNTKVKDPAGLDDQGYSTAYDLAFIANHALTNENFKKIILTPEITIHSTDNNILHYLENSNRLIKPNELLYYEYSIGVKTGFTPDAGHCLVSAAIKDNHKLISVILNTYENSAKASAQESKKILKWGYENYRWSY